MANTSPDLCPTCGAERPANAPRGLCPRCLLRRGIESDAPSFSQTGAVGGTGDRTGPPSVLETLDATVGPIPSILLRDTDAGSEPPVDWLSSPVTADPAHRPARLRLFGEIARGGMGAVLRGRDEDLGRDLAVKVLLQEHQGKPELARRFVEEAQIGGQLQHPGIVPVHELGTFADRRPYFTMKLVRGRTLAALLSERKDPHDDLPRFLGIFEQVAQTMAYAHARGVIHRDLKPSNVMVGSFGEVQVMDWGLAKVLKERVIADEIQGGSPQAEVEASEIRTVRSSSTEDESQAGSVLGTPAYMAPEQAGGDIERVDRRADVFGLGSILCEVLTGQPVYTGRNNTQVFGQALRGDTSDARTRLHACGANVDLVTLASECLAPQPADRPTDAGVVTLRITAYLAGVQEKLRAAERERAVAEARAIEERRRRKLQAGLATAVLALTTVGGLSTTYYLRQRQARAATVAAILGEAAILRDQARDHAEDPARWRAALVAIRRVDDVLGTGTGGSAEFRRQSDALRAELQAGFDGAERDEKLLDRLVDIRSARADDPDGSATDLAYADAFKDAGIDLTALAPVAAGEKIKARPPATALALAVALDDWAAVRLRNSGDRAGAKRLSDAAGSADPDPWRCDLRAALDQTDRSARLTALEAAARSPGFDTRSAVSLHLLGKALADSGDPAAAETVLRAAQRSHPTDLWINYELAVVCANRNRRDDALRFYTAARSIRPASAHALAHLLERKGESDEAIAVFQDLARLRPRNGDHLACLGKLLRSLGRPEEAGPFLDAAVAVGREAIRLRPDDYPAHNSLGMTLNAQGKLDEAIAEFREMIRLKPDDFLGHNNLAGPLRDQGKHDEAIAEFRTAIRLKPNEGMPHKNLGAILCDIKHDYDGAMAEFRAAIQIKPDDAETHTNVGVALNAQEKLDEAIAEHRTAIRLKPDLARAHLNLAYALRDQGKRNEAIAEYRETIRLRPDDAQAHTDLALALTSQGKRDEAIAEFRTAIRLRPNYARGRYDLGYALQDQGKRDEAVAEYRAAIRLEPDYAEAHCNLGFILGKQGHYVESLEEFHRGHELGSKRSDWRYPSARWLRRAERLVVLAGRLPAVLKGDDHPRDTAERVDLAQICYQTNRHAAASRLWAEALATDPGLADDLMADHLYNAACSAALAGTGNTADDPAPDEAARSTFRSQAHDWLHADLGLRSKQLGTGKAQARAAVLKALRHWKSDPDLAGVRQTKALEALPEMERGAWRALWSDVDALETKTGGGAP